MNESIKILFSNKNILMFLVVLFIFSDIVCENFIGIVYNKQPQTQAMFLFLGFMLVQILFAPVQSALSDLYGRRKSLIISLFFSLLSLIFVLVFNQTIGYFSLIILATISKGIFGNTLPISLAVIADTQDRNYRLSFAFSTGAYAVAYLILILCVDTISEIKINSSLVVIFIILIFVCAKLLKYSEDIKEEIIYKKESHSIFSICKNEAKLLAKDLSHNPTRQALAAFFLWETSLYSILISQVDFQINKITHIAEFMMYGYLLGVIILGLCKKLNDNKIIKFGYYISGFSLIPYFLFFKIVEDPTMLLRVCYFFHALGNAFLSPALLSILAKERKPHEQGRIYGLTDSIDTFGYLFATVIIILVAKMNLDLIYLISFSFVSFMLSFAFFSRFQPIKNREA